MYINSLSDYLKKRFGHKVYKVSLDAGMTCPNRDGTISNGGCIFCSEGGSGDFASNNMLSITNQIDEGINLVKSKIKKGSFIAYFQAFSNTYASVSYLEKIFTEAINHEKVEILSIATRPDCIDEEKARLLGRLNQIKPVWVELGLQTSNEVTARFINRGYENVVFEKAVKILRQYGVEVIVHIIIGLPGEDKDDMINTIKYLNSMNIQGIKIQLLHVLKNTVLADYYLKTPFKIYSLEEYTETLVELISVIRGDIVIHRITGDGPKKLLIEPKWSANKKVVLNYMNKIMKEHNVIQGSNTIV